MTISSTPAPTVMRDYAWNIQARSVTVHFNNGDDFVWPENHPNLAQVREAIKNGASGDELRKLMDVESSIRNSLTAAGVTGLTVTRSGVFFNGELIHMTITERILQHIAEELPVEPLILFLGRLLNGNQRREAVLSLYDFLEANNIPITEDGCFIVYKKVKDNYLDIYSGTMDNSVGKVLRVPAWQVEANRDQTCAKGLHVCSRSYLPHFGVGLGNRVVICKVDPADVVAVPRDYNNAKMRVCGYEVIGELNDSQKADIFDKARILRPGDFSEDISWGSSWEQAATDEDPDEDYTDDGYPDYSDDDDFPDDSYDSDDDEAMEEFNDGLVSATQSCGDEKCPLCNDAKSSEPTAPTPAPASDYADKTASRPWIMGLLRK